MSFSSSPFAFSVAPMMDWTDRHCRVFHRLLSRHAILYTEMVTDQAILHGDPERVLGTDSFEKVVLQIGGSIPSNLAAAAKKAKEYGYHALNFNCGCPSSRVQSGRFGACLMHDPEWAGRCVAEMREASGLSISVKCRLGIDDQDETESLPSFVETVSRYGCDTFIVHARKAWLQGLSPKENREIPPLRYDLVFALKEKRPDLNLHLNGGVTTLDHAVSFKHHGGLAGVMVGRAAYHQPWMLSGVDPLFYDSPAPYTKRSDVLQAFLPYLERAFRSGAPLSALIKPIFGLYFGQRGGRVFRRLLSERGSGKNATPETLSALFSDFQTHFPEEI